jgi:hypothetical protein
LIAQSTLERREVAAANPLPVNVTALDNVPATVLPVTPKLTAARVVAPKRTRVRAVEVKPAVTDPFTAIATAITDLVDPPKVRKRVRVAKAVRKVAVVARTTPKAVATSVASAKPRRVVKVAAVRAPPSTQFRAGHTTYAEDRYRQPVQSAAVKTAKKKRVAKASVKATPAAVAAGAPSTKASKQAAGMARSKTSAVTRKGGGWQSSAVFDLPLSKPALTGPQRRIPARDLRDETEKPLRGPLRRVQPSALV